MLVEVKDKVISTQIFEKKFVCDLNACKGACCIEGHGGAPLAGEELSILEDGFEELKPYMREEGIRAIEEQGVFYIDQDNETVTTLVNKSECAFVSFDDSGITKCSIEIAHAEGKFPFKKPISCHLYPIRVKKFETFQALNFSKWDICAPACDCGEKLNVPVFRFLKEPLIRAFGEPFYKELLIIEQELKPNQP
jgi:hypothetical protein